MPIKLTRFVYLLVTFRLQGKFTYTDELKYLSIEIYLFSQKDYNCLAIKQKRYKN